MDESEREALIEGWTDALARTRGAAQA
jgi:hypothetical protein